MMNVFAFFYFNLPICKFAHIRRRSLRYVINLKQFWWNCNLSKLFLLQMNVLDIARMASHDVIAFLFAICWSTDNECNLHHDWTLWYELHFLIPTEIKMRKNYIPILFTLLQVVHFQLILSLNLFTSIQIQITFQTDNGDVKK